MGIDSKVAIVAEDDAAAEEARLRLARVGIENVAGSLDGGISSWFQEGRPVQSVIQISAVDLAAWIKDHPPAPTMVDVRETSELSAGSIPGAISIPLPQLSQRLSELHKPHTVVVHCKGGYRSSIAASDLQAAGFEDVVNLTGGFDAWKLSRR